MEALSEIKENIRKIASQTGAGTIFTAEVKAVDGETCSIDLDGLVLNDVRLRAVVNSENSKILVTPKIGSNVLVADMNGDKCSLAVIGYSEVDKIEIDCNDKIIINGGNNSGMVKIKELTQKLNELVNKFNAHTHPVPNGTSSTTTTPASAFNQSDYENTKITQ